MNSCSICGGNNLTTLYRGPIRIGRFGNLSNDDQTVWKCEKCGSGFLPNQLGQDSNYYESAEYRKEVDDSSEVSDYFKLHDGEQSVNLQKTGTACFRNKLVADIGCGGGSFLDAVRGYAKQSIAIEPSKLFRDSLSKRGYTVFPYAQDAIKEFGGAVDIITSFSVLEHVENPLEFLKEIRQLLSSKGKLVLSTPNGDDFLLEALPEIYPAFFYRKAHLWYFNPSSIKQLLEIAGFTNIKLIPYQRFGLSNFISWLRDKKPKGHMSEDYVSTSMNAIWKAELERTLRCDYLYIEASIP